MNEYQQKFVLENYQKRSVKELAKDLGLDRKEVQREIRRILAAQGQEEVPAETATGTVAGPSDASAPGAKQPAWRIAFVFGVIGLVALIIFFRSAKRDISGPERPSSPAASGQEGSSKQAEIAALTAEVKATIVAAMNLGSQYLDQGNFDGAIAEFEKVLKIHQSPKAYGAIGLAYWQKGDLEKAIEYTAKGAKLDPKSGSYHNNLAHIYFQMENVEKSVEEFEKAAKLEPNDPKFRNNYGMILMEVGRMDQAQKEIDQALKIAPDFDDALYSRGTLFLRMGKLAEAEETYTRLLKIYPDYPKKLEVQENLGQIQALKLAKPDSEKTPAPDSSANS